MDRTDAERPAMPAGQTATDWLLALGEDPHDDALRRAHGAWLNRSERNRQDWQDIERTWAVLGALPRPASAGPDRPPSRRGRLGNPLRSKGRRAFVGIAAAIAATVAMAVWGPGLLLALEADYATGIGDTRIVTLEDGSSVTLGADSAIAIDFLPDRRALRLLRGEAFFDVVPDPDRPFTVAARQTMTTVYGTAFDVRTLPGSVAVAVEHGRVGVQWAANEAKAVSDNLGADDWLELDDDGNLSTGRLPPGSVAAWRSGKLVLQDRPISDVVDAVSRHFHGTILVADSHLLTSRITGVFDLDNPEDALVAALHVQGGQVHKISPWLLIVTRN